MTKTLLVLFIILFSLPSCLSTKTTYGQFIIDNTEDSTVSKQKIAEVRALDNNVFDPATFTGQENITLRYRLFKPTKQNATEQYPLVIVYHGSGKPVGTDNQSQLGILPKLFANPGIQDKYPAYVLAPQFPTRSSDYVKDSARNVLYSIARPCLNTVLQLIDSLRSNLNIDSKRIYVVGFSMGGSTVINSLSARPDLFAAGISISGIPQFDQIKNIATIAVWLIHGMDDTENPIDSDEQFYRESNASTLFWKLKGTTHNNVFTTRLLGETLPKWLFKQRRK